MQVSGQTQPARQWLPWALALGIAAAAFVPFIPALKASLCVYDDPNVLLEVDGYRGLSAQNLRWMFSTTHLGHYQPLTWLSYALDFKVWGLEPLGFHLTNLLIHSVNAALVYLVARRLIRAGLDRECSPWIDAGAAFTALAFGLHPLRVESVAWITERRDVLSALFLLAATLAYLRAFPERSVRSASNGWYAASIALLLLSLLSKAWGMSFFVVVLILDWYPLRRLTGPPWRWFAGPGQAVLAQKIPYAALGVAAAVMAGRAQASMPFAVKSLERWGIGARVAQSLYGLMFYFQKLVWPRDLAVLHELPRRFEWTRPVFVAGAVFTVLAGTAIIAGRRRVPGLVAAGLAYAVVLAPVLGVMQSGPQLVADRYSYIANIGWAVLAGGLAAWWLGGPRPERERGLVGAACLVVVTTLGALSWRQTELWQDSAALFKHAIDSGSDGPVVREIYGQCLMGSGRVDEALAQFVAANDMDPEYSEAWFSRANALRNLGRFAEAEPAYRAASRIMSDSWRADLMLGMMYLDQLNRPKDAEACFRAAVANVESPLVKRFSSRPYLMLAAALDMQGDTRGAREWLNKAAGYPETRDEALRVLHQMDEDARSK
jgi:tetratricopeptide (TPR) repeat protein